ncbi:MAG: NAD-binding protein [Myxococcota bacterium]|jgi:voltage-gated potassium channel|nr:NAD-binding protein [Myxococcota bacterium]
MSVPQHVRERLTAFFEHAVTNAVLALLIVFSIVLLLIEMALDDPSTVAFLELINELIIAVFLAELSLRFLAERRKSRFFRDYWLDLLAVLPALRVLRILRVFRLMRVFRFGIYYSRRQGWLQQSLRNEAVQWFGVSFYIIVVVLFAAIGMIHAEQQGSLADSLWWSVMSLVAAEPIGAQPISPLGKAITLIVMCSGATLFAMLTGVLSAVMVHRMSMVGSQDIDFEDLREHVVICGWSRSALMIVSQLTSDPKTRHKPIVLIGEFREEPKWPPSIRSDVTLQVFKGDSTKLENLEKVGIRRASHAIILADQLVDRSDQDRDARSVLTAMLIERCNKAVFTSVELLNRDNETFLKSIGVDEIVVGDEYAASILAAGTRNPGIVGVLDELLSGEHGNHFASMEVPAELLGLTFCEAAQRLKEQRQALLIGVYSRPAVEEAPARRFELNPPAERKLRKNETLLLIAQRGTKAQR